MNSSFIHAFRTAYHTMQCPIVPNLVQQPSYIRGIVAERGEGILQITSGKDRGCTFVVRHRRDYTLSER